MDTAPKDLEGPGVINGFKLATKADFEAFRADCEDTVGWNVVMDKKTLKVWDKTV
jgi:hypothetical protein